MAVTHVLTAVFELVALRDTDTRVCLRAHGRKYRVDALIVFVINNHLPEIQNGKGFVGCDFEVVNPEVETGTCRQQVLEWCEHEHGCLSFCEREDEARGLLMVQELGVHGIVPHVPATCTKLFLELVDPSPSWPSLF